MDVGCPPREMAGMSKSGVVFHATFSKWGDKKLDFSNGPGDFEGFPVNIA